MSATADYAIVNAKRGVTAHRIAEISYPENRLICSCDEWMAAAGGLDWRAHKASVGEPVNMSVILGPAKARKALRAA